MFHKSRKYSVFFLLASHDHHCPWRRYLGVYLPKHRLMNCRMMRNKLTMSTYRVRAANTYSSGEISYRLCFPPRMSMVSNTKNCRETGTERCHQNPTYIWRQHSCMIGESDYQDFKALCHTATTCILHILHVCIFVFLWYMRAMPYSQVCLSMCSDVLQGFPPTGLYENSVLSCSKFSVVWKLHSLYICYVVYTQLFTLI